MLSVYGGKGYLGQVPIVKVLEDTSECSVDVKGGSNIGCVYAGL